MPVFPPLLSPQLVPFGHHTTIALIRPTSDAHDNVGVTQETSNQIKSMFSFSAHLIYLTSIHSLSASVKGSWLLLPSLQRH